MKTQTTFRKKALLGSTAMMLVALLALGTATYAWFTNSPTSNALGLTLKATSANGLVIQTATHNAADSTFWEHTDYLNYDSTSHVSKIGAVSLNALSFDLSKTPLGDTAFSAVADSDSSAGATVGNKAVGSATNSGFYQEKVYCKLKGSSNTASVKLQGLTVNFTEGNSSDLKNAIRIAVSYHDAGADTYTLVGVYSRYAQENAKYLKGTAEHYNDVLSGTYNIKGFAPDLNATAGNVHPTGNDYFEITVYLDGEQSDCFTNNVNLTNIVNSINLDLALAA